MTIRTITIKIDAGETTCDGCQHRRAAMLASFKCEAFGKRLRFNDYDALGPKLLRLPECLASEVKEPDRGTH